MLRGARPARPRRGRRGRDGRLLRLPVVERLAGQDLHGRHRVAGPRRRAGRPGDPDPHRAAAARARRPVRAHHAVGDHPGRLLQADRQDGCSGWPRCSTTSSSRAGARSPSSSGSGSSPGCAWRSASGFLRRVGRPAGSSGEPSGRLEAATDRSRASCVAGLGVSGFAAADGLCRARRAASRSSTARTDERAARRADDPRAARRRASGSADGDRLPGRHRPGRHLARLAAGRTRCSPRRPRPASRSGARSSWPGGCAGPRRRAVARASPAPTARPRPSGCSSRSSRAAGARATAAGNVGSRCVDAVLADPAVRRARGRAVQLPAALDADSSRPLAAAVLNLAARPPRLARLDRRPTPPTRAAIYAAPQVACVYNADDPRPSGWSREADVEEGCRAIGFTLGARALGQLGVVDDAAGRPRLRRRTAPRAAAGARRPSATSTRRRRTTSPTRWPPPRWPAPTACRRGAVARRPARLRARPAPHRRTSATSTASPTSTTPRRPTRTPPPRRCGLRLGRVDRRRPGQGRRRFDDLVQRRRRAAARRRACRRRPGADRRGAGATRAGCPGGRGRRVDTDTGAMDDEVVRAAAALAAPGRHRAARARPARRWTCSATTASAATCSPPSSAAARRSREPATTRPPADRGAVDARPPGAPARPSGRALLDRPLTSYYCSCSAARCCSCSAWSMVLSASQRPSLRGDRARRSRSSPSRPMWVAHRRCRACSSRRGCRSSAAGGSRYPPAAGASCSWCSCWSPASASRSTATATGSTSVARSRSSRPSSPSWRWCCGAPTCWPASGERLRPVEAPAGAAVPVAASCSALVMLGGDLGTALVLIAILAVAALAWPAPRCGCSRLLAAPAALGRRLLVGHSPHRMRPLRRVARPVAADPLGNGCRPLHGLYALASGGWWGSGSAPAGRSGATCPRRTPTSSSPSSARSSAWSGRWSCCCCSRLLGYAGLRIALRDHRPVRPARRRRRDRLDRRRRRWSTSAPCSACCRSPACRCRWSPTAARRCSRRSSPSGCCCRSPRAEPGRGRGPARPAAPSAARALATSVPGSRRRAGAVRRGRCTSSSPAAGPPATSSRARRSPTRLRAPRPRRRRSPRWAPSAGSRPGSSRRAATSSR